MNDMKAKVLLRGAAILSTAMLVSACGGGDDDDPSVTPLNNHVTISSGSLNGNAADASGIVSFKGIPYAAPPVGPLRWKEPQPVAPWSVARDATTLGTKCWAANLGGGPAVTAGTGEDCLYLNVWSGAKTRGAKLPVMVWVHGGGFQFGTGSDPQSDGTELAKRGVIVVTINYRLGVFGFLARPDLDAESGGHKSGMYGIQDTIAALQWVKDNIAQFGGDPTKVTVFGESAGAHAVGMLMSSPLATGLFHRAIGESGAYWESEMKTLAQAQAFGAALGPLVNATTLDQLRAVPAAQLQNATPYNLSLPAQFSPFVDGYVLPELPYLRFAGGRQNDVPLLAGVNAGEGIPFMGYALPHNTATAFINAATTAFGAAKMPTFLQLYPATTDAQAVASAQTLVGDLTIRNETWTWANQQYQTGKSPVYFYNFDFTSAFTPTAAHTDEIAYVFGNLLPGPFQSRDVPPSALDRSVSATMQSYWTNFAKTGNPNATGLPAWPKYTGAGSQALNISQTIQAAPEEGTARYQFLNQFRVNGIIAQGKH